MSRTFDGTDDTIGVTGGPSTWPTWAGFTIAGVWNRRVATGIDGPWSSNAAGSGSDLKWDTNASALPRIVTAGGTARTATTAVTTGWEFDSITKATGTVIPRRHMTKLGSGTWLHEDYANTVAENGTAYTDEVLGNTYLASSFFDGDIAWVGLWNENLSDTQVEAMAYQHPRKLLRPSSLRMYIFNQSDVAQTVRDLCGSGAAESSRTGTAIGAVVPYYPASA